MNHRELGGVGEVSEVGYGAWQSGGDWGFGGVGRRSAGNYL